MIKTKKRNIQKQKSKTITTSNKLKYPINSTYTGLPQKRDSILLKRFNRRRKLLLSKLEAEFKYVTHDAILAIYLANIGNRTSFKKLVTILLLGNKKSPNSNKKIKGQKTIHKPINTKSLDILYDEFEKYYKESLEQKLETEQAGGAQTQNLTKIVGGPYLQRLTSKGDAPITGNDLSLAIEDISTPLGNLQYLQDDGGPIFRGVNTWLNYFNGNPYPLKEYIRYYFAPQFYKPFPPSINFTEIYKRLSNITDLLSTYSDDKYIRNKYLVENGYAPAQTLKRSAFDKVVNKISDLDNIYNRFNSMRTGRMY